MPNHLIKKMSSKAIMGNVKGLSLRTFYLEDMETVNPESPKSLEIFQIIGVAKGFKTGDHETNGPWVSFQGSFKAVGLIPDENGEIDTYRSSVCFLPEPASSMLHSALDNDNNEAVELAFIVGIAPCKTPIGYEYIVKPVFDPTESDAIAAIEAKMLALAAPKKEAPASKPKK